MTGPVCVLALKKNSQTVNENSIKYKNTIH